MSRTSQFAEAFTDFASKHFIDTGSMCIWELKLLTKNTRKKIHDYELIFPKKYLAYHLDKCILLNDGTTEGPGPVYLPQEIPPLDYFIERAHEYFGEFGCTRDSINSRHNTWGVRIGELKTDNDGNKIIEIHVVYGDKHYMPYPARLTKEQELEKKLEEANRKVQETENKLRAALHERNISRIERDNFHDEKIRYVCIARKQQRIINQLNIKTGIMERSLKLLAKESYRKGEPQDCPICFEQITLEKLHTTICGHTLCTDCNAKCTKCPLCRENY